MLIRRRVGAEINKSECWTDRSHAGNAPGNVVVQGGYEQKGGIHTSSESNNTLSQRPWCRRICKGRWKRINMTTRSRPLCETKLTLSVSNAISNTTPRSTVNFTAPSNSRSIRATSPAIRRRFSPETLIKVSAGRVPTGAQERSSRMVDKCGDVAGLNVERAIGIQGRPPYVEPALKPKLTSRRFGSLEKSKDRANVSLPSTLGSGAKVNIS